METSDFDFKNLFSIFELNISKIINKNNYDEILVAYSGGSDSTALLYFANELAKKLKKNIKAVHVNHNLNSDAKEWEEHCKTFCNKTQIPLVINNLNIILKPGDSIEERAREQRYLSIYSLMSDKTIMMTAHHQDDQAETLLFQLFRGSGVKGLSGMPVVKKLNDGYHVRPFLNLNKNTLEDFIIFKELVCIKDTSNENTNFSRNFIRKEILPKIKEKWSNCAVTISRAAENLSTASRLNEDLALIDIQKYLLEDIRKLNTSINELEIYRFNNVIRFWIKKNSFKMPSTNQLSSIYNNVLFAGEDKVPFFSCSDYEIRRHNDYIEIMNPLKKHDASKTYIWRTKENLVIPNLLVNLSWVNLEEKFGDELKSNVEVKFRQSGENIKFGESNKSLKDYMRENEIPPWQRDRVLLIYINKELKIIWDKYN
jgi:tRNA(Ile)-lysidine synthase